jgi:hypothetical protein
MIQEGMEFDAAFGAAAGSPGEQRQTEAHHGGIQAVELVFELEFVLRGQWLAAPVHQTKQRLKEGGGRWWLASAKVERATGLTPRW